MRLWLLFLSYFICTLLSYSQELKISILKTYRTIEACNAEISQKYKGIQGSPYLNDTFIKGKLILTSGKTYQCLGLKFDAYAQQLIILAKDSVFLPYMNEIAAFETDSVGTPGTAFYKRVHYKSTTYYYQVIEHGRAFLYIRKSKLLKKGNIAEFHNDEPYFIAVDNGSFEKLKTSKRSIIRTFPDNHYMLEMFLSAQKLDITKLSDIRKLVRYYNRLLSYL